MKNAQVEESTQISRQEKICFSSGLIADHYASQSIIYLAIPIYNILFAVNPAAVGFILGLCRFWDAISDPIVGSITDNLRTRTGRRKPAILAGAILTGGLFPLLWAVDLSWSENTKIIYFSVAMLLYYTAYTVFSVSYNSLSFEMTPCYSERTKLYAFRNLFAQPITMGIFWLMAFIYSDIFSSPIQGTHIVTTLVGALIIVCGLLTAFFSKERYYKLAKNQQRISFWQSIKELKQYTTIWILVTLMVIELLSSAFVGSLGFYLTTYYVFSGDIQSATEFSAYLGTASVIAGMCSSWLVYKLSNLVSKEKIILWGLIISLLASVSKEWTLSQSSPNLLFVSVVMLAFSSSAFWISIISMIADFCDWDEYKSGVRREGSVSSIVSWFNKAAMALGVMLAGATLSYLGFEGEITTPSMESLLEMKQLCIWLPIALYSISIVVILLYPLTKDTVLELRAKLESIRGSVV
ncbi:MFS transporter [Catenovulum agarivorans]|uniref:MFS transporter n=1 Tax=Catenovulum agarivorans TaxID=1172192 RepID=UPI0002DB1C99|nr:MFS transporter [Catenovulum agarivorans]